MTRSAIPSELRRAIYVEAGHRCAIHTCKSEASLDVHHIIPWEECQAHEYDNLIALCPNCHRRAHNGQIDKLSLRNYKNLCQGSMESSARAQLNQILISINHSPIAEKNGTWIRFAIKGTMEIIDSNNISSIADTGYLDFGFNFASEFQNSNYVIRASGNGMVNYDVLLQSTGQILLRFHDPCPKYVHVEFF